MNPHLLRKFRQRRDVLGIVDIIRNGRFIGDFTRATSRTYFDSTGTMQTAAINTLPWEYDPDTLAARGFSFWEARSNSFQNSVGISGAVGVGTALGPDNAACRSFIPTSGAVSYPSFGSNTRSISLSAGQTQDVAFSAYIGPSIAGSQSLEPLFVIQADNSGASQVYATLQINTTTWAVRSKGLDATMTEVQSPSIVQNRYGMYFFTWVVRYTQDGTARNQIVTQIQARTTAGSGTYTADGIAGLQYAYGQAEFGSFVTPTIATTNATVARSADIPSLGTSKFSSLGIGTSGTIFFSGMIPGAPAASTFPGLVSLDDGTLNNRITLYARRADDKVGFEITSGGVSQASLLPTPTLTYGTKFKVAGTYATNDIQEAVNGTLGTNDTSATIPTVDRMQIGYMNWGINSLNGYCDYLGVIPGRQLDYILQGRTL